MKKISFLIWFWALVLGGCMSASAATTWNMATGYPASNYQTQNVQWFADAVAKATDGALKIKVHSGSSMIKLSAMERALRTRQVPIAQFVLSSFSNEHPIFEADSIPFLAVGFKEAAELYKIQKPMVARVLKKEGIIPLYEVIWPGNGMYTSRSVHQISDIKGMKIRAQTPLVARLDKLLGAVPVNVPFMEVPQAFSTHVITAMFTAGSNGADTSAWDYTNYFYNLRAYHPRNIVAVNEQAWKALPQEIRQQVKDVAERAEKRGWDRALTLQRKALDTLAAHGMTVVKTPSPELMAQFRKVGDQIIVQWADRGGPDAASIVKKMQQWKQNH